MVKHKNESSKVKFFKLAGHMVTVNPGELVDLPYYSDGKDGMVPQKENAQPEAAAPSAPAELEKKSMGQLRRMTKDQLNDYAAERGWREDVSTSDTKKEMLDAIQARQK